MMCISGIDQEANKERRQRISNLDWQVLQDRREIVVGNPVV
jgi:hypothetical protein